MHAEIGKALSFGIRRKSEDGVAILGTLERKINERGVRDPEAIYKIAQVYAQLGDKTSALRVMSQSIENGFFPYPYFAKDPLMDVLRQEDTFSEIMSTARRRHEAFKMEFF